MSAQGTSDREHAIPDDAVIPQLGDGPTTPDQTEHDFYTALAARAVNEDYTPIEQLETLAAGQGFTSAELAELVRDAGDPNTLPPSTTPRRAAEARATEDDLAELIALNGRADVGSSPK